MKIDLIDNKSKLLTVKAIIKLKKMNLILKYEECSEIIETNRIFPFSK